MNLIKKLKSLDKGTIFRTVMQFLAYVNQVVAVIGNTSFASAMWYQIITVVLTIVTTAVSYWYNNDWTNFAHLSSDVFEMLKDGQITEEELKEFKEKHKKNQNNKEQK